MLIAHKKHYERILIALDYDPTAQKVAEAGYSLAKAMAAEIILLHVISDAVYYSSSEYSPMLGFEGYIDMGPLQFNSDDALKKVSRLFLDKSKRHLGDTNIQTQVKEGDFAESILKTAKDSHVDIIVMGSHSRKWLEEIVMGSVTEKVLRHSLIPLLIVPTKKH
jgi:nucleotide-binding universal stress UspA family protein